MVRMADCHPDRPHCARGMCRACYDKARMEDPEKATRKMEVIGEWRKARPERVKEYRAAAYRKNREKWLDKARQYRAAMADEERRARGRKYYAARVAKKKALAADADG